MHLEVLLPARVFLAQDDVTRIVAETRTGSYGFLPHRLDCVATLQPGILAYQTVDQGEVFVAVAEGVLVKTGLSVIVSVRNAIGGVDLANLRWAVEQQFENLDEHERKVRASLARLESGFIRRFLELQHG
jgi:F-type H+-transporting ATPase subunit epsilon